MKLSIMRMVAVIFIIIPINFVSATQAASSNTLTSLDSASTNLATNHINRTSERVLRWEGSLISDIQFRYEPLLGDLHIYNFLSSQKNLSLPQLELFNSIKKASIDNGISERVILVLIEQQFGIISGIDKVKTKSRDQIYSTINHIAEFLSKNSPRYFEREDAPKSETIELKDHSQILVDPIPDYNTLSILKYIASFSNDIASFKNYVTGKDIGFQHLYSKWYNIEPESEMGISNQNSTLSLLSLPSDALLPFVGQKRYTGGPHGYPNLGCGGTRIVDDASGIDFARNANTDSSNFEVISISGGWLRAWGQDDASGIGKYVKIEHQGGIVSQYWHLNSISQEIQNTSLNNWINRGFLVGVAGKTGGQTSEHLHLELRTTSGTRVGWHGQQINGYQIWIHRKPGTAYGFDYQGSATIGSYKNKDITGDCGLSTATVGTNYNNNNEQNGVDSNTIFAWVAYTGDGHLNSNNVKGGGSNPPPTPDHSVQLYKEANYLGGAYCYADNVGTYDSVCSDYNDQISSILLKSGWSVRVYKHAPTGSSQNSSKCFTSSDNDLSNDTFDDGSALNDQMSSMILYNQSNCPSVVQPPSVPALQSPSNGTQFTEGQGINLSWSATGNEYYGELTGGPNPLTFGWQTGATKDIGSQWAGYTYSWHVKARNSASESGYSSTWIFTVKPGTPTNLGVQVASCSQINLSWADNSGNEDGYKIYHNGSLLAQVAANTTNYQSTGLSGGTAYSYNVRAFKGSIESDASNTASATTSSCPVASAPTLQSPSDGAAFNEGQAITLAWSATGNEYYGEITGGPNPLTFGWQTGTSKDIGSQWPGYTYSWHVKARNSAGESGYSGTRTFTVKPGAPTNLSAQVASCSQINLSWGDNSGSEDGYKIYRDTMLIGQVGADATSYQNTGLSGSTGYTYMVKAFKGSIESNASNDATISTSACPAQVAAGFDAWPQSGEAPLTVAMHNISSGDFTACAWDYGDGTTGTSCADYHDHIYDQPGTYTVRLTVSGAGGTDSQTLADYINVSPPPCIDAFEPDDTAAQAHDFTVGSTEDHALCAADDQDWVSFSAVAGVRYQIETLDLSQGTDTILDLYQSDGSTLIISDDDGNGNFASLIAGQFAVSGVYYVKTRAYQGVGAPAHTYSLRITAQCSDSYEPDNSAAQSHQFAVGTTEPHAFCEQNDQDWVTIAATAGTTYRIETLNLAPGADTVLDLYQSDGSTLITSDDDGNGQLGSLITWQAPAAGTYYVKARDYSASGDATRRYDLRITASQPPAAPALQSPANAAAFNEGQSITLAWSATGAEYYGEVANGIGGTIALGWQAGTSSNIGSQQPGYTYSWRVKARSNSAESLWSATRTFVVRPAAPTNLSAQAASCSQINLAWADNSAFEEGYSIYQNGVRIAQVAANATSYQPSSLSESTSYSYIVKAYKGTVESNASNTVSAATSACLVAPAAAFDAWPQIGDAPLTVAMHNISTGNYTNCSWNYGDGATGTSCAGYHDHVYTAPGRYTVQLTVSGPAGTSTYSRPDYIIVSGAAPAQNLLANPGFELDTNNDGRPDSWSSSSKFTRSTTFKHGGAAAGKHAATDNSGSTISLQVNNLQAGKTYRFGGWIYVPATTDSFTYKTEIRWRNSSGSTLRTDVVYTMPSNVTKGVWLEAPAQASLVAPVNTANAQVRMVLGSLNAAIYVDDFTLQEVVSSDATPPQVMGKTPSASATSVALGTNVTATFNEVVTGVSGASFTLTPQGGTAALAASVSYDTTSRTATLNPTSDLAASTTYIVNLTSSIKDSANNALVPVTWSFTTAPGNSDTTPPQVTGKTPSASATSVALGTNVTATFNEVVTGVSGASFTLTPQGGTSALAASVSYDTASRTATLNPTSDLAASTTYIVNLTSSIKDSANNALVPVTWSFTTAPPSSGGATFTFASDADTYVSQASATTNYATATSFSIVGGTTTEKQAFIRFVVSGLPSGAAIQSAKLRLYVTNDSSAGGVFTRISNNTWAETISWNTKPALDGVQVASLGAVPANTFIEVDLTSGISGNGTYSFAITLPNSNTNTLGYATKEASTAANRPQLIITT